MYNLFLVASGGAVGAMLRFGIGNITKILTQNSFYGTLTVNILGSFLIGYLISIGYIKNLSNEFIRYFLIIGFLGSFTTFSAFSYEVIELYLSRKILLSFLYILFTVTICVVAAYLGMYINKF